MYTAGIDVGSVGAKCIVLNHDREILFEFPYRRHFGRVVPQVIELFRELYERFPPEQIRSIAMTGNHGKMVAQRLGMPYEYDSVTQIVAVLHLVPDAASIITMGDQDASLYRLSHKSVQ